MSTETAAIDPWRPLGWERAVVRPSGATAAALPKPLLLLGVRSGLVGFRIGRPEEELVEIALAGPFFDADMVPRVRVLAAVFRDRGHHLGLVHPDRCREDRLHLRTLALQRTHHDVP